MDADATATGCPRAALPLLGAAALALALGVPYFEAIRNANERPRLLQGIAMVECGSWAIDGPSARGLAPGPDVSRSPRDGRLYPNKPPATSVVAAAAYRAAVVGEPPTLRSYTVWARLLGGWLPTVLLGLWAWRRFSPDLGAGPTTAAIVLYALATPAAAYAHLLYGHQLAAAFLIIGAVTTIDGVIAGASRRAALGGLVAGLSVTVEYGAAFAGLPLALALLVLVRRHGRTALHASSAAILGALLPALLLAAYHQAAFGSPWATGYHHVINPEFAAKHGQGLLGLGLPSAARIHEHLLAASTGLLWWGPLALVGFAGLCGGFGRLPRPLRAQAWVLAGIFGITLLVTLSLSFSGGWRVGPRYLVIALPAMIPGLAWALAAARERPLIFAGLVGLATWSLVLNGLAANLWPHIDPSAVDHPFAELLLPLARAGARPYDLLVLLRGGDGHVGPGDLPLAALVGGATLVAAFGSLLWITRSARTRGRTLYALIAGLVLGGVALVGAGDLVGHPRAAANLRYVQRVWEPVPESPAPSRRLDPLAPGRQACRP